MHRAFRRISLVAILCCAMNCAAFAQTPPPPNPGQAPGQPGQPPRPPQPPGKITGHVLRADTGRPLTKSSVMLMPEGRFTDSQTVRVDGNGVFEFVEVPPGRYRLTAERNGYVRQTYGQRGSGPGVVLEVHSRQVLDKVQFSLERGGVISGVVLDEDNEAVEGVEVRAQRLRFQPGGKQRAIPIKTARADDLGAYRLTGLSPGAYYVQAGGRGEGVAMSMTSAGFSYAPLYYPGVAPREEAQRIQVVAGGETRRIDFSLRPGNTYTVSGLIVDATPTPGIVNYAVGTSRGGAMASFGVSGEDNKFSVRNLEPGEHQLFAMAISSGGEQRRGYRKVTITDADQQVVIEIGKTATISGEVKLDGETGAPVNLARVFVGLQTEGEGVPFAGSQIKDGRFEMKSVPEGAYTFAAADQTNSSYLKEARCGGEDFLSRKMNVVADQVMSDCVLLLGHDIATAIVAVTREGKPGEGAIVVFIPKDEEKRKMPRMYATSQADPSGTASVRGIVPGEYYVYALSPSDDAPHYDLEFYARNRDMATSVIIRPNDQQTLALKVVTPK